MTTDDTNPEDGAVARLRLERKRIGWNQVQAARVLHVNARRVSGWETGKIKPSATERQQIKALVDDLARLNQRPPESANKTAYECLPLGRQLRMVRHGAEHSQSDAAHLAGVHHATLAEWEEHGVIADRWNAERATALIDFWRAVWLERGQ